MDGTDTPENPASVSPDPNKLLIAGAAGALMFLGIVLYANASAVRAMRRTSDNLDALVNRILENASRPAPLNGEEIASPPAGRPEQPHPGPRLVAEPDPAAVPNNGAGRVQSTPGGKKAESGDASAQS